MFNRQRKQLLAKIHEPEDQPVESVDDSTPNQLIPKKRTSLAGAVLAIAMVFVIWRASQAIIVNFSNHERQLQAYCEQCKEPRIIVVDTRKVSADLVEEKLIETSHQIQMVQVQENAGSGNSLDRQIMEQHSLAAQLCRCLKCGSRLRSAPIQ